MTAQETLFQTKEQKEQGKRVELIAKALAFWATSSEEYRNLPYQYFFLLEEKRRLGLSKKGLPITMEDWPMISLFFILDFEVAKDWLNEKSTKELENLVTYVDESVHYNYAYCSMREWVRDATYLVSHYDKKKKKAIISEPNIPWA